MKKFLAGATILIYAISTVFFFNLQVKQAETAMAGVATVEKDRGMSATDLGVMCINTSYPSMGIQLADSRDNEGYEEESGGEAKPAEENKAKEETVVPTGEPQVLIVHTHATESYLPHSGGNFHSKDDANTVRDVGDVMAAALEKKGIAVVHNKTLHDDPSYNNAYSRSYETTAQILKQYPSIQCVIDLHRDAVSSEAPAATVSVGGKTCAKYSYVVGTGAATYSSNLAFIKSLNETAKSNYNGFTGNILERGYKYNQDLSSKYLLIEIGYNRNQIEDCRNTAEIVGNILADTLKKG